MTEPFDPRTTPWSFDDDDFYELESSREQLEFLLRYAVLAPSTYNQQPWSFRITKDAVDVFADRTHRLPVIDPGDRELTMSIGAAIANLRVAAAHFGFESTVLFPASEGASESVEPVATIAFRQTSASSEKLKSLFTAIKRRHTNRTPFDDESLEPEALSILLDVVDEYPETFSVAFRQDKQRVADLIVFADQMLMASDAYRSELATCMNSTTDAEDGLAADTPGIPPTAHSDRALTMSAALLLIVTADDDSSSLLRAGEVLEYLLLTVTRLGFQYSFLNAPIQRADLRDRVEMLVGSKRPAQLILRIGHGQQVTDHQPRRPLEAVVA